MLITPKNAVQWVLERKTEEFTLRLHDTVAQKWAFRLSAGGLVSAVAFAVAARISPRPLLVLLALAFLLLAGVFAVVYQLLLAFPDVLKLRNVEREASSNLLASFNDDMDLIQELARTFEAQHLAYAKSNFLRMARQLRERIALLVGAIDKVGVVPLAVTGYVSYLQAVRSGMQFGGVEWLGAGLVFLYLVALRMTTAAQWMEKMGELYDQALAARSKSMSVH